MKNIGRTTLLLAVLGALFVFLTSPVLAQEEPENTDAAVTESGEEPAVVIPDDQADDSIPDWTYRYMVPATLLLGAVVILATSIKYFTNVVRKRYRTVEE